MKGNFHVPFWRPVGLVSRFSVRDRFSKVRANVQRKRTRNSRRLPRRLSGRERRFQEWLNHNISKQLVAEADLSGSALAFEDLTGIRDSLNEKPRSKTERRRTNNWAFYQLRLFVNYKAAIAGVLVVLVPPAYTSQTCSRCRHVHPVKGKSYRNGKKFNYQPGSPSVYLEGINLSAAPRTPNKLLLGMERSVGCRYGNRQLFFYTPR